MKKLLNVFILTMMSLALNAQSQSKTLTLGDKMPEFKYAKWIKGTPIKDFNDDKVYIFEFWATWCGPCIAAMPHLSELSEKYKGKVEVIGVNVLERVGDKPYESSLPVVEKFVKQQGARIKYNIATDNNALFIAKNWLEPAGINGIPATILVKNKKVQWIGHPVGIDEVIDKIIDNTYDINAIKAEHDESLKAAKEEEEIAAKYNAKLQEAVTAKDYKKALTIMDEHVKAYPAAGMSVAMERFPLLLNNFSETEAISFAKEAQAKYGFLGTAFAASIVAKEGLSKESYLFGVDLVKGIKQTFSKVFILESDLYEKAGDIKNAYESRLKALGSIELELADKRYEGFVTVETRDEYKKSAAEYRTKLEAIFAKEMEERMKAASGK